MFLHRALVLVACLGVAGCVSAFGGGMSKELRQSGVPASAEILEMWDTGWTINDSPVIGMKVRVLAADRPAFEARINKTTISRLATSQFQPGNVVPVRFDPNHPAVVAVDFHAPARDTPSSGNPYGDRFVRATSLGAAALPTTGETQVFLGTADSGSDAQALYENEYSLLGGSGVRGAGDLQQALDQGKEIGAALVVVYGRFVPPPGLALDVLPYRPRPAAPAPGTPAATWSTGLFSSLGSDERFAAYWRKTRPGILGIVSRPLEPREQARLGLRGGVVVEAVANGSPAEAARIAAGDVIVAVDGKPLVDSPALPALLTPLAGTSVRIDLIRNGSPLSVTAKLNAAPL